MAILRPLIAASQEPPPKERPKKDLLPPVVADPAGTEESKTGHSLTTPSARQVDRARRTLDGKPLRKFVPRKAQQVSQKQISEMFAAYCQLPNAGHVARVCGLKISTVKTVAKNEGFEARRVAILERAQQEENYTLVQATRRSIQMVRDAKEKLSLRISTMKPEEFSPQLLTSDLEKLVKIEQLLLGGVESREEKVHVLSHEERIANLRELRAAQRQVKELPPGNGQDTPAFEITQQTINELASESASELEVEAVEQEEEPVG